jgi:hypothetical protein
MTIAWRSVRRLVLLCALVVLGLVGLAGTAGATTAPRAKSTFARLLGPVIIDRHNPRVGYVFALYRCTGEGELWVSVKQTADRKADPRLAEEGSSAIAAAWSDSHRNPVTCNGRIQLGQFTVDQQEPYFTESGPTGKKSDIYAPLARGKAWVKFCLFDDNFRDEPQSDMRFRSVL